MSVKLSIKLGKGEDSGCYGFSCQRLCPHSFHTYPRRGKSSSLNLRVHWKIMLVRNLLYHGVAGSNIRTLMTVSPLLLLNDNFTPYNLLPPGRRFSNEVHSFVKTSPLRRLLRQILFGKRKMFGVHLGNMQFLFFFYLFSFLVNPALGNRADHPRNEELSARPCISYIWLYSWD